MSTEKPVQVETLTLDDGRRAERHVFADPAGHEVVEIFAEEKRPLKLEKRIVREYKNIVSKETHQTVRDGNVTFEEVRSLEPEVPLQLRERLAVADHHKIVDGDYVRKDEINGLIADGVVAGVNALMEHIEPAVAAQSATRPVLRAQEAIERTVVAEKKNDWLVTAIFGTIAVGQIAFMVAYYFLWM